MIPNHVVEEVKEQQIKDAQVELLNWFMQLCGSGATTGMLRKIVYNRLVELTGEGEKA